MERKRNMKNILFLTILKIEDINEKGIYTDLLRCLREQEYNVYVVSPTERRYKQKSSIKYLGGITILSIQTLNIQKTNIVEKGISMMSLSYLYKRAIKKYFPSITFDILLYATPPITFEKVIRYLKYRDQAMSYLMLKDIFPQNAVDIGMFKQGSMIHRYFRKRERALYDISDHIGCMSPANKKYLLQENPYLQSDKVEICPNAIEPSSTLSDEIARRNIRNRYNIPENVVACIYGGNLGKPQGINFIMDILYSNFHNTDVYFVIAGSGTEFKVIEKWFINFKPTNALLIQSLPKIEYDSLVQSCDIGLIFLDSRFTIPNFPSRILSYMEAGMPVLAATDKATDLGKIIEEGKFGLSSVSGNVKDFNLNLEKLLSDQNIRVDMGRNSRLFLEQNYTVKNVSNIILKHLYGSL